MASETVQRSGMILARVLIGATFLSMLYDQVLWVRVITLEDTRQYLRRTMPLQMGLTIGTMGLGASLRPAWRTTCSAGTETTAGTREQEGGSRHAYARRGLCGKRYI